MDRGQEVGSSTAVAVAEDGCLGAFLLVADELATTRQTRLHPETFRTKGLESFSLTLVRVPNPHAPRTYIYEYVTIKTMVFLSLNCALFFHAFTRQANTTLIIVLARHTTKELFSALASVGRGSVS
jgi:hypothetical protein